MTCIIFMIDEHYFSVFFAIAVGNTSNLKCSKFRLLENKLRKVKPFKITHEK